MPLQEHILDARDTLAHSFENWHQEHQRQAGGVIVCTGMATDRDTVIRTLYEKALADHLSTHGDDIGPRIALVAHGGYGRGRVAPFSDVDLMLLHAKRDENAITPLAERLWRDIFDAEMICGHSVRTPEHVAWLASEDSPTLTSLAESRRLEGDKNLFSQFEDRLRKMVRRRTAHVMGRIMEERKKEQNRFGDTAFLLEPNVKRSQGGLRDIQLIRWIGFVRFGTTDFAKLVGYDALTKSDHDTILAAEEFLLDVRNEMHFHTQRATDTLDRSLQLHVAARHGFKDSNGLLGVETFMRDYFRHTGTLAHIAERFVARARSRQRVTKLMTTIFGHNADSQHRIGPSGVIVTQRGIDPIKKDLAEIMRTVHLAAKYDKPIAVETWETVRRAANSLDDGVSPEASERFLSFMGQTARLGRFLRDMHQSGILSRFVPEMEHVRGLMQFNHYHKYTVDEHSIRAVECAARLIFDHSVLGGAYRKIARKDLLHLALLLHDLGKGRPGDHSLVGAGIAVTVGRRLGLDEEEITIVESLVRNHLMMNHLAFRRDTEDIAVIVNFAREVGSPEMLRMLYVMTAADLNAVGPNVWDSWKADVLAALYSQTRKCLEDDEPSQDESAVLHDKMTRIRSLSETKGIAPEALKVLEGAPHGYLFGTRPEQIIEDAQFLGALQSDSDTLSRCKYLGETDTICVTIATGRDVASGVFHRMAAALASLGLQVLSARIYTFAHGLVLDRFEVRDPYTPEKPTPERLKKIDDQIIHYINNREEIEPTIGTRWGENEKTNETKAPPVRVKIDNNTSEQFTILDVFTRDRAGLLYSLARELHREGLSVMRAKIGTYLDEVVDVFYVTDARGEKLIQPTRIEEIRRSVLEVLR